MRILARTTMVRTVMRMIQRIQRAQQGTVSRTTMRVRAVTHPGANLRQRTVEMGAPDDITAAEDPRRRMRMTPVRRCVAVTVSNRAPSMVRVRSSRFVQSPSADLYDPRNLKSCTCSSNSHSSSTCTEILSCLLTTIVLDFCALLYM